MPEGVDIKPKITKGGKGSGKKRKGGGSDSVSGHRQACLHHTRGSSQMQDTASESSKESEVEEKPKVTTPRQKAAAQRKANAEQVKTEVESPVKKVGQLVCPPVSSPD